MAINLYQIDVPVVATAYIKARSREEAERIGREALAGSSLEVEGTRCCDVPIDGGRFSLDMPDVSLSPAMTVRDDNIKWKHLYLTEKLFPTP